MTPRELSKMLAKDAETICRQLLPAGKRQGSEWCVGDLHGSGGDSLRVHLTGNKAGVWKDFATDERGGDLLDLYAQTQNAPIRDAINWAKEYLGVLDSQITKKREYRKPDKPQCRAPQSNVRQWLTSRGITDEVIQRYRVAEQGDYAVFPFLRDGELVFVKYRHYADKKNMRVESGCEPILFGWQAIPEDARSLLICEGEIDALSWSVMGVAAVSVPNGAQGHTWIENDFESLERFDDIYLSFDMDEAGQKGAQEVADRLGRERCKLVKLPKKDANECLQAGLTDWQKFVSDAKPLDPDELKHTADFTNVVDIFTGDTQQTGYYTPWQKVGNNFRFRPGEFTVLAGENHHGKSQAVGHFVLECMSQGAKACVASLEYKPEKWVAGLCIQACAMDPHSISRSYAEAVFDWVSKRLWAFTSEKADIGNILKTFRYARRRYGVDFFVVDNLEMCDVSSDDYENQRVIAQSMAKFCREESCHMILVHHLVKNSESKNRHAIKGSGSITNLAHNVILWSRNEKKESEIWALRTDDGNADAIREIDESKADAWMTVDKQRETGWRGKYKLWFDPTCRQFISGFGYKPKRYVNYSDAA